MALRDYIPSLSNSSESDSDEQPVADGHMDDLFLKRRAGRNWSPTQTAVEKQGAGRKGQVPQHIEAPIKGRPRPFNPFALRDLATSEVVQGIINTLTGDLTAVEWSVVPVSETVSVPQTTLEGAEELLRDVNPNPESFADINEMMATDLLEVGNCVAATESEIDSRLTESIPLNPDTFTVDWNDNRILEGYYQYPHASESKWGDPIEFDSDEIMWGTYNPTTVRSGFYGRSPVDQIGRVINVMGGLVEKEIGELEEGMPSGMIALTGEEWTTQNYENFKAYWREEVTGEQMKHPIAEGDAQFVPFNMTYKELQVLDRQQWYAKLVGSAFRVPVSETGLAIGETMTRATDVSQRQRYKRKALGALIRQLEELWTVQFLHRYISPDIELSFDMGTDLAEKEMLANIHKVQLESKTRTINEVREEMGAEPVEWGDTPTASQSPPTAVAPESQTPEMDNQQALDEGMEPEQDVTRRSMLSTVDDDENMLVRKPFHGFESWDECIRTMRKQGHDKKSAEKICGALKARYEKAFRSTDEYHQFEFQPSDFEPLIEDLSELYGETIDDILNDIRGNQQFLRLVRDDDENAQFGVSPVDVQKAPTGLMDLVADALGLDFAEELAQVIRPYKRTEVVESEDSILGQLPTEELDVEQVRDRVVERVNERTLQITKPISQRLESVLRDILSTAWQQGHSITKIEEEIETVSEQWQGYEAERLARDQIGRASKEGRLGYAKETGHLVGGWEQEWITTQDHRTRDSHTAMDGETTPVGEPFVVDYRPDGGPATVREDYPGDSVHGIQCRCDVSLSPMTE